MTNLRIKSSQLLSVGARWASCGGVSLYMVAISAIWMTACRKKFSWVTVVSISIALGLAIFGGAFPPLVLEGILLAMLVWKVSLDIRSNSSLVGTSDQRSLIEIDPTSENIGISSPTQSGVDEFNR